MAVHFLAKWSITPEEVEKRERIVLDIQEYIVQYYPTAKLELFGSSCNGFGLLKSDIDICLTFTDSETGKVWSTTISLCEYIIMYFSYLSNYKEKVFIFVIIILIVLLLFIFCFHAYYKMKPIVITILPAFLMYVGKNGWGSWLALKSIQVSALLVIFQVFLLKLTILFF